MSESSRSMEKYIELGEKLSLSGKNLLTFNEQMDKEQEERAELGAGPWQALDLVTPLKDTQMAK